MNAANTAHGIYALLLFISVFLFLASLRRDEYNPQKALWARIVWWILHIYMYTYMIGIVGFVALIIFELGAHA